MSDLLRLRMDQDAGLHSLQRHKANRKRPQVQHLQGNGDHLRSQDQGFSRSPPVLRRLSEKTGKDNPDLPRLPCGPRRLLLHCFRLRICGPPAGKDMVRLHCAPGGVRRWFPHTDLPPQDERRLLPAGIQKNHDRKRRHRSRYRGHRHSRPRCRPLPLDRE